jgi:tetratricopeptide (TPR) repeat protein
VPSDEKKIVASIERGNISRRRGDFAGAVAAYDEALKLAPDFVEVMFFRGMCFYYDGEFKRGAADFDRVVALSPDRLPPRYWRGLCRHTRANMWRPLPISTR